MRKYYCSYSDETILTLLKTKQEVGVDALYSKYGSILLKLIYGIVKQEDIAEVVLQDTMLKVWHKADQYIGHRGKFSTWLINIARYTAIDMIRSKHFKQSIRLVQLDRIPVEKETVTQNRHFYYFDLKDIVGQLDQRLEEVVELVYFQGYTCLEASKVLDIPLGTVKSRIRKAISDLRMTVER